MTSHLDLDRLADVLADQAPRRDADHVAGCPGCASRLDELATAEVEVAAVLALLGSPPVPHDLSARLAAALAAEPVPAALPDPDQPPTGADHESERFTASRTVTPFPAGDARRARAPRTVAAGVAVLLAAGGVAFVLTRSPATPSTSVAASSGPSPAPVVVPVSNTGADYATGSLAAALPSLMDAPARAPAPAPGPLAGLHTADQLRSCLAAVLPPGSAEQPLALDYAAYRGQPALVVVLPASAQDKVDVFVVGAGCRTGDDQTLYFTRLDRPAA